MALSYTFFNKGAKYIALGDFVIFMSCGPLLTLGYSLLSMKMIDPNVTLLGCLYGVLAVIILHANNLNDLDSDKRLKVKTVATILGFQSSKVYMYLLWISFMVLSFILFTKLDISYLSFFFLLLFLKPIIEFFKKVKTSTKPDDEKLFDIRMRGAQLHLLASLFTFIVFLSNKFVST
jgi:1,4-dihydroxy-2-naphthoate octaprenyltransferase